MTRKTTILYLLVSLSITIITGAKLLQTGYYNVHDNTHVARLYLLNSAISSKQIPAVWADQANFGYGYPLFHLYAPAFYYLTLTIKLISASYIQAIKTTILLISFLGSFGMMMLTKKWGKLASILSAVAFATLPYRASGIFVRGSYAELLAMSLLPWLFLAWTNVSDNKKRILAIIITTAFFLSHNLVPLITIPFLVIWALLNNKINFNFLKNTLFILLASFSLGAFYFVPLIFERNFTQVINISKLTDFATHFLYPSQLWASPWGFGGSASGIIDGMSFIVGKVQLILVLLTISLVVLRKKRRKTIITLSLMLIASMFLSTFYSGFIWDNLPLLQVVQFPWRFLTIIGFLASLMAGLSITFLKNKVLKRIVTLSFIFALMFFNLKYFKPQSVVNYLDADFINAKYLNTFARDKIPEYLPVWMTDFPDQPPDSLFITDQEAVISDIQTQPGEITATIKVNKPTSLIISKAYYPTWKLKVDNQLSPIRPENGLIATTLERGNHNIRLFQSKTINQKISLSISLITLLYLSRLAAISLKKAKRLYY